MKKKYNFCLFMTLVLLAFLLVMSGLRRRAGQTLAARIAPEILRFHVIANSDSPEDQAIKLEVKDLLLEEIRALAGAGSETSTGTTDSGTIDSGSVEADAADSNPTVDASVSDSTNQYDTRDAMIELITKHRNDLEQTAESYMSERGFDYPAEIRLETCEFPEKTYGDMTFPAGTYDAVRVVLGNGDGQNFWCVLYPSLCYMDSTYAVVPDASKETLKSLISEDDFQALLCARKGTWRTNAANTQKPEQESSLPRLTIRFKLAELFD